MSEDDPEFQPIIDRARGYKMTWRGSHERASWPLKVTDRERLADVTKLIEEVRRLRGALQFLVDWHEQAVHDPEVLWEGFERGRRALDGTDEGAAR